MSDLKLCPFCGRFPVVEDCGPNRWFVRCGCGIAQDKLYHQRCDAVKAWNRRKTARPDTTAPTTTPTTDTIDRQAAIDEAYEIIIDGQKFEVVQVETLMGLPPAQPEIIHCCECKYWKPGYITDDDDFVPPSCAIGWVSGVWRATDYCSNAERKQDGQ